MEMDSGINTKTIDTPYKLQFIPKIMLNFLKFINQTLKQLVIGM
jgi:hypothetical protein